MSCNEYHDIRKGETDYEEFENTLFSSDPEQEGYVIVKRFDDETYWKTTMRAVDPDGRYRPAGRMEQQEPGSSQVSRGNNCFKANPV